MENEGATSERQVEEPGRYLHVLHRATQRYHKHHTLIQPDLPVAVSFFLFESAKTMPHCAARDRYCFDADTRWMVRYYVCQRERGRVGYGYTWEGNAREFLPLYIIVIIIIVVVVVVIIIIIIIINWTCLYD